MTDEELSKLDELSDDEKGALKVDNNNIAIYTHAPGNYNTNVEGVAATVTDSELTVFIEVSGAKVDAGKKPYVLALDNNGTKELWGAQLVVMTPGATMPTDLEENVAPPPPAPPANCGIVYTPEAGKIYLKPSDNWLEADARFAVKFITAGWATQSDFYDLEKVTGLEDKNIYEVTVPSDYTQVVFLRMNPAFTDNGWNNDTETRVWKQMNPADLPQDSGVVYVVEGWDNASWLPFATE